MSERISEASVSVALTHAEKKAALANGQEGAGASEAGHDPNTPGWTYDEGSQTGGETGATTQEGAKQGTSKPSKVKGTGKKLSIVRHAERMDRVFPAWLMDVFEKGRYQPIDLNHPLKMPPRKAGMMSWLLDPPLTEIGRMSAQMLGRGLRKKRFRCTHIYASPSYRCIETAVEMCKGMSQQVPIRVEPGLFEWMHWYRDSEPEWLKKEEMQTLNWDIDTEYEPMIPASDILSLKTEPLAECYDRLSRVTSTIAESMSGDESVLIVAHGLNVDAGTRGLRGLSMDPPDQKALVRMGLCYPNLSFVQVEEQTDDSWRSVENPVPPISHLDVTNRIDPKVYNRP